MSNPIADPGHGHSPAAWTAVIIMLVALHDRHVAYWFDVPWLVWASAASASSSVRSSAGAWPRPATASNGSKYTPKEH